MALNPNGWLKMISDRNDAGQAQGRPVSITIVIVDRLRTCKMMTINIAAIIDGENLHESGIRLQGFLDIAAHLDSVSHRQRRY